MTTTTMTTTNGSNGNGTTNGSNDGKGNVTMVNGANGTNEASDKVTAAAPVLTVGDPHLEACLEAIEQVVKAHAAGPFGDTSLTATERKGVLKLPPKGAKLVMGLVGLWGRYGAPLPTVDLGQLDAHLAVANDLRTVVVAAKSVARALDDSMLAAEQEVWATATQIYTLLQTIARADKTLAVALEPYAQYFQRGAKTHKRNVKNGVATGRGKGKKKEPAAPAPAPAADPAASTPAHPAGTTTPHAG